MDHAQGAQGFDQCDLPRVQVAKGLVALPNIGKLYRRFLPVPGKQHPEILNRRPHAAVVHVNEMGSVVRPENIPRMAVAVKPDPAAVRGPGECLFHRCLQCLRESAVSGLQIYGDETVAQEVKAHYVTSLRGPTVKFLVRKRYGDAAIQQATLDMLKELATRGIRVEACGYALEMYGIEPEDLYEGVTAVGNSLNSLIGFQSKGYALVMMN